MFGLWAIKCNAWLKILETIIHLCIVVQQKQSVVVDLPDNILKKIYSGMGGLYMMLRMNGCW